MPIYFYSARDAYGCFSNFSPHGVALKGAWWPTTEHYFQAQKFAGTPYEDAVRLAKTPKQATAMGRDGLFGQPQDAHTAQVWTQRALELGCPADMLEQTCGARGCVCAPCNLPPHRAASRSSAAGCRIASLASRARISAMIAAVQGSTASPTAPSGAHHVST